MPTKLYIINAFTGERFGGNPAAVVPLRYWLPEEEMRAMAAQHNLSETAFVVPHGKDFAIRWLTPTVEVDLCGHATLASAHVFFNFEGYEADRISFHSKSGPLHVTRQPDGSLTLDFPANPPVETAPEPLVSQGLGITPVAFYTSSFDFMAVLEKQADIEHLAPDFTRLAQLPTRGLIVTAPGNEVDFVSRCFYPQSGVNEDPVTGSAHTVMAPYWAARLGKNALKAVQLSVRRGELFCECRGDRVLLSGRAVTYLVGELA